MTGILYPIEKNMTKNKVTKSNDGKMTAEVGLGLGMLAALSAGAYYLYGTKEGVKKRLKIRGWMLKAKGEMMEKMENMKEFDEKISGCQKHRPERNWRNGRWFEKTLENYQKTYWLSRQTESQTKNGGEKIKNKKKKGAFPNEKTPFFFWY